MFNNLHVLVKYFGTYHVKRIQNNIQWFDLFRSVFSIRETINSFYNHWNSQESIPITTTWSQGINYPDHLSVMWMSGPEGVTEKEKKKQKTARTVMRPHAKMKLPTCWQRVSSDPKAMWRGAFAHLHCCTLALGKCFCFFNEAVSFCNLFNFHCLSDLSMKFNPLLIKPLPRSNPS